MTSAICLSKICFKCSRRKPLRLFYKHPYMADGYLNKCICCTKKDTRKNYATNREHYVEYGRKRVHDPKRKASTARYQRKRRAAFPGKERARRAVHEAIRTGRLARGSCEVCGDPTTHGHHDDYRKPLEVRWLCHTHHWQAHGALLDV